MTSVMRKYFALGFVVVAVIAGLVNFYGSPPQTTNVVVTRVIDGDTVVVEGGERVRLLTIDTPEKGQSCYTEAKDRLTEMVDGKEVRLVSNGREDKDLYGRLLRYIFLNDTNINLLLVREGWANLYIVDKDQYYNQFREAEQSAKEEGLCVWK